VQQGWISSGPPNSTPSEAILFEYESNVISLKDLIALYLHSHSCTNAHSLREKYKSAVYVFNAEQDKLARAAIHKLQSEFEDVIITQVLYFKEFELNEQDYLDYYYKNPEKPFCKVYIAPKLKILIKQDASKFDQEKTKHLNLDL